MSYTKPLNEPIALVGSSCRFAGGISSPSALWKMLSHPQDLSLPVPVERFNATAFHHTDGKHHGTTNSVLGYWLEQDHRVFDAQFFNIAPKEAEAMDPQQRLLLEVVYEAIESAGYTLNTLAGRNIAVFAGCMTSDHGTITQRDDLFNTQHAATGNAASILSNRISYFFDFHGPSQTIDTACSASLVALHQAVQSLRMGESEAAVVTGVNLMLTPEQFIVEANLHMLSPTGKCHMWDERADGYARGEGVAALFLKPLSRALADGDTICTLIRETGTNSDGRTQGITMPNPEAQAALIRNTYRKSGLDTTNPADRCQYFEAHGTGTPAGDPKEASAIDQAFFNGPSQSDLSESLLVGSVKTVLGHTEGAAGLAGVLKVVQAMGYGVVPPNLHLRRLNPSVSPYCRHLCVPTTPAPWPRVPQGQPLRASVNSFGFGGANAHAILERYDPNIHNIVVGFNGVPSPVTTSTAPGTLQVGSCSPSLELPLVLSANSPNALAALCAQLAKWHTENAKPLDLAWTLYNHRTTFQFRAMVPGPDVGQGLENIAQDASRGELATQSTKFNRKPKILGVFTGQGAQWATMARGLLQANLVFSSSIAKLDDILQGCAQPPGWKLAEELVAADPSRIQKAEFSQPLSTAVQIALVDLLFTLGIELHTVVGHSSGEIGAAYAAGRLSARDAILISHYRGQVACLAAGLDGSPGGMAAAALSKDEATRLTESEPYRGRVHLAASNTSSLVTLSGDSDAIDAIGQELRGKSIFVRRLAVDTAYHCPHMFLPAEEYVNRLDSVNLTPLPAGKTAWVSSVPGFYDTGKTPDASDLRGQYWADNMTKPVLFREAMFSVVSQQDFDCAIEIGPHPALKTPSTQIIQEAGKRIPYSGILHRNQSDTTAFSNFLAFMWLNFGPTSIDLKAYIDASPHSSLAKVRIPLPPYPWDHSRQYYRESRLARQHHFLSDPIHELLGRRTRDDTPQELRWRNYLKLDRVSWIQHHKFQATALLPASAYCVMALDAARAWLGHRVASMIEICDLELSSGMSIGKDAYGTEILFSLRVETPQEADLLEASFTLESAPGDGATEMKKNCSGRLRVVLDEPRQDILPPRPEEFSETLPANVDMFYNCMRDLGLEYTGPFRGLETIGRRLDFASSTLSRFHAEDTTNLSISPATLDCCFHSAFAAFASPGDGALWTTFLPIQIDSITFNLAALRLATRDGKLTVDSHITAFIPPGPSAPQAHIDADAFIYDESGHMEIQVEGLRLHSMGTSASKHDPELYLHNTFELDPEDCIITMPHISTEVSGILKESSERVASFYLNDPKDHELPPAPKTPITPGTPTDPTEVSAGGPAESGGRDTRWALEEFISSSPYFTSLALIRNLAENLPVMLPVMLPTVMKEAAQLSQFQAHISNVVKQICHRYPRMNVLTVTDTEEGLARPILSGLGSSFLSLTIGGDVEANLPSILTNQSPATRAKVATRKFGEDSVSKSATAEMLYDLAIVSTTTLSHPHAHLRSILKLVRKTMTLGGFLLLIQTPQNLLSHRIQRCASALFSPQPNNPKHDLPPTPPDWPDILHTSGFVAAMREVDQHSLEGFSLIVRQVEAPGKQVLTAPLDPSLSGACVTGIGKILIIGGASSLTASLVGELVRHLSPHTADEISVAETLESIAPAFAGNFGAVILLMGLDEAVVTAVTDRKLDVLRSVFRPGTVALWVTHNAKVDPEQGATFGLTRSILAEVPSLSLQTLDLDSLEELEGEDGCGEVIAKAFVRLAVRPMAREGEEEEERFLWTTEREVFFEKGRRVVARVVPYEAGNKRVCALRRPVFQTVNSLEDNVEVAVTEGGFVEAKMEETPSVGVGEGVVVVVEYSSARAFSVGDKKKYICIGRCAVDGRRVVVAAEKNASYVTVEIGLVWEFDRRIIDEFRFLEDMTRILLALQVANIAGHGTVVLLEPQEDFIQIIRGVLKELGIVMKVYATSASKAKTGDMCFLHPHTPARSIRRLLSSLGGTIFDFLPSTHELSHRFKQAISSRPTLQYYSISSLPQQPSPPPSSSSTTEVFTTAIQQSLHHHLRAPFPTASITTPISIPDILSSSPPTNPFALLCWPIARQIPIPIFPFPIPRFSDTKTYLLIGLTRDLGQSLTRLLARHGARHILLASRNPPSPLPNWVRQLAADYSTSIVVDRVDITKLRSVRELRMRLTAVHGMPGIVGGVVNGAMVLEDRVFAGMDEECWNRVLGPKVGGSSNLEVVFDPLHDEGGNSDDDTKGQDELEFFIMTSSFAATGGHGGQSNYAVANMYMNTLSHRRRLQGRPSSALNLGVIHGIGLLHRDQKTDIYESLAGEGYPPVSERDIHHIFLTAVLTGRPPSIATTTAAGPAVQVEDVNFTCGLSRYNPLLNQGLHWHRDPRFSHFTTTSRTTTPGGLNIRSSDGGGENNSGPLSAILECPSHTEAASLLFTRFTIHLQELVHIQPSSVSPEHGVADLGVDSLAAVEIRAWLWREVGVDVGVMRILGSRGVLGFCLEIVTQAREKNIESGWRCR